MSRLDRTRAEFDDSVSETDLRTLAGDRDLKVLQCSAPVSDSTWILLNSCFFAARPDVELRMYGHYSTGCDLRMTRHMTNVQHFAADCLMHARNVECIAAIPHLESLSVGIFDLQNFRFLEQISPTLTVLSLGPTQSKMPRLAPLTRFRSLKTLNLEGQRNDIEALSHLQALEDLTLRSVTTPDLTYLAPLKNLWSLDIKLGGIRSFAGIEGKAGVKYLELWQVRELHDMEILSALPGLQNLFLQSLPHITSLPPLSRATQLRRVVLQNLKGMNDFGALEQAPALEEFGLLEGRAQVPEQLVPVLRNPHVQRVSAGFGSDRKNRLFSRLRSEYRKSDWALWEQFEFQ